MGVRGVKHVSNRIPTREVMAGNVGIGGKNPVRVQSMTSTPTSDTRATVGQILRIVSAGAEMVRMTVRNIREAENLENIKREVRSAGCNVPLVADVHFNPAIAEVAATIVEKVRINPGNYGISPGRGNPALSDDVYREELMAARTAFSRLLSICRRHGTALRIGVNHGSLSPRIINRYGNTPSGMVASAMEFLQFCAEEDFHNVVISLKSSNTRIMVESNRMMFARMQEAGRVYPLHLGVTEAGEGEDGRIRSVAGIGTLLWEGIGDTIRVSLTEEPELEIPVARKLIGHIEAGRAKALGAAPEGDSGDAGIRGGTGNIPVGGKGYPATPAKRQSFAIGNIGGESVPVIIGEAGGGPASGQGDNGRLQPDFPFVHLVSPEDYLAGMFSGMELVFLQVTDADISDELLEKACGDKNLVLVILSQSANPPDEMRLCIEKLEGAGCRNPVIFKKEYDIENAENFQITAAADFSPLFIDRSGDGLWLVNKALGTGRIVVDTAFSILQSTRVRTSKTEFISCPSCGRTTFDIQKATAAVKQRTSHLKGLTIAVMGCIVNGPGEMADADYGYVGSGKGRVNLYRKQQVVKKNIPQEEAVDELISLIKESGDWVDG
jgi:(E)-4-hydroxy-3-methylbut-2-enyl-diphosphate synthase